MIEVQLTDNAARALAALARSAAHTQPLMDDIGNVLVMAAVERHETQTGPDGQSWAPLAVSTLTHRRNPDAPILIQDAHLRNSWTYLAAPDRVAVGSNLVYAATHQFGRDAIPARPALGASAGDQDEINRLVMAHFREAFP